jgi:hypothetical protein
MAAVILTYSIGEFTKIVGVSEHTLRYYEKEGLIKVNRDVNNVRVYSDKDKLWVETFAPPKKIGDVTKRHETIYLVGVYGR